MKRKDYEKFTAAAKELGAERVKKIGFLDDHIVVEAWEIEGPPRMRGEGFILMRNIKDETIGVYQFVGKSGAPVERDIKWLIDTNGRVRDGKAA